jgi:predicted nucleic acid-binding protein
MIFVDTGAWIGLYNEDDQYHAEAKARWKAIPRPGTRLVTSNFVFAEAITFLARECNYDFAARQGRRMMTMPGLDFLRPAEQEEQAALEIMGKFADQEIGYVDCLSFALMRRYRIKTAFAFDRHFEMAGFEILKKR